MFIDGQPALFQHRPGAADCVRGVIATDEQRQRRLNYELAYISISKQGIESLRYRHAVIGNVPLGQLLHMDGPRREVLQRGGGISYFEPGLEPFTLTGDHIVDALPAIVYADFTRLAKYYDFISVGSTRIADRPCEVLRVVARDGSRYSYIVWMDEDTKLPLRVDLLDRDGETLEQYRVILRGRRRGAGRDAGAAQGQPAAAAVAAGGGERPAQLEHRLAAGRGGRGGAQSSQIAKRCRAGRIPALQRRSVQLLGQRQPGGQRSRAAILPSGRRTIQTEVRSGNEITIVGELPPATAKRIADSISFKVSP